jgi:hypothetical protein
MVGRRGSEEEMMKGYGWEINEIGTPRRSGNWTPRRSGGWNRSGEVTPVKQELDTTGRDGAAGGIVVGESPIISEEAEKPAR